MIQENPTSSETPKNDFKLNLNKTPMELTKISLFQSKRNTQQLPNICKHITNSQRELVINIQIDSKIKEDFFKTHDFPKKDLKNIFLSNDVKISNITLQKNVEMKNQLKFLSKLNTVQ